MQQGEGTDPLREALREALEAIVAVADHCGGYRGAVGMGMMETIAREALAAAPEPEWEYRACLERDAWRAGVYRSVPQREVSARSFAATLQRDVPQGRVFIERRRKAGAWEALPDD